ncbi:MAG: hypothetical protein C5B55_02990 [Blastocatellia bacterium]|nr:MAG: hypothetical protein C5B55_02990 [Blastocatellia bacterium]
MGRFIKSTYKDLEMKKLLLLLSVLLAPIIVWTPSARADDAKAQEILKQARAAIGGEETLAKLESITLKGQYRRMLGERQLTGDRELNIQLPDKYVMEDAMNPGGLSTAMLMYHGLNGEQAWNGQSGGGGMVFKIAGPGGQQATPEQMEAALRRMYRIELTRYLLALLVTTPSSMAVDYKYVGESEVETIKADVVEVSGPDKFTVRIFFDQESHVPLLLSYRGPKPRMVTMTRNAGQGSSPEQIKKMREDAEEKLAAEPMEKPEEADFYIRLTDHKKVNGVLLPFKFTFLTDTDVSEEFEIAKYQLNPQFKADKFQKH